MRARVRACVPVCVLLACVVTQSLLARRGGAPADAATPAAGLSLLAEYGSEDDT